MKLSIITTTYNSAKTLEDTIKSVLGQMGVEIEYIIIDGGSTDGTIEIANKYTDRITKIISEPDRGMYEAMNKGIKQATGDIVGILNSDDFYASLDVIRVVADEFEKTSTDCVWGDLVYVDKENTNKTVRNWKSSPYREGNFQKGWHPPHPALFVKREVYQKYGLFRTDLGTAADYELMLRFLEKEKIRSVYIPKTLVKMRNGGMSNKSYFNLIKANFACYRAFKLNNLPIHPFFIVKKPLYKLGQFSEG